MASGCGVSFLDTQKMPIAQILYFHSQFFDLQTLEDGTEVQGKFYLFNQLKQVRSGHQ